MRRLTQDLVVIAIAALGGAGCGTFDPSFGYLDVPGTGGNGTGGDEGGSGMVNFHRDIRPIMDLGPTAPERYGCKQCHYPLQPMHVGYDLGGLDLSTLGGLRRGGATSGKRIVIAGDPDNSAIVQKLRGTYPYGARMPRQGDAWGDDEMALITNWIEQGAQGADDE